jgi:large subunit ribosomal protein L15
MRIGRGNSAGGGTTGGRGTKGQKSRSGRGTVRGFEGGQLRMIKGLPMKRGFINKFRTEYALVMVMSLDQFEPGERVSPDLLRERGIVRDKGIPVKVLGDGELTRAVTVVAHKFTRSARQKIEAAGGTVEEI